MRRSLLWVVALLALGAQLWVTLAARQVLPYEGAVLAALLVVSAVVTFVRARLRGRRVADTLRPDAQAFAALQDDLLGRSPSGATTNLGAGPVAMQVESHDDPAGDLLRGDLAQGRDVPREGR